MLANLVLGAGIMIYYYHNAYERLIEKEPHDGRNKVAIGWYAVAGFVGFCAAGYVHLNYTRWIENSRLLIYSSADLVVGLIIMVLVIDITYRSFGRALSGAVLITLVYGLVGASLPGFLRHRGMDITELIARQTIVLDGIYGNLLQIGATWVAIFILFAGFVEAHGGFDFINRLGMRVATLSRSGIAQSSVISSMLIGMLTGGAAVNVALTGSFTIPLMKNNNIPSHVAAGIESVASSGSQILPPVMGLAAFLIADYIGVRYADVIVAGTIPALLFYMMIAVGVHILIISSGFEPQIGEDELAEEISRSRPMFAMEGLQYLLPLLVLVYLLIWLGLPIMLAGGFTCLIFLGLRLLFKLSRLNRTTTDVETIREFLFNTVKGFRIGAVRLAPFVGLLGALGMIITTLEFSGIGVRLATTILIAGGGEFLFILIIVMFVSLLFGLGMPTVAAYILVASILAPALTELGMSPMTAHLFLFYFALLSAITPPVAIAVAVASEIAETEFMHAVKTTLKLGAPAFAIPYIFVANPSLIEWTFPDVVINVVFVSIGMLSIIFSLTGSNGRQQYSFFIRGALAVLFPIVVFVPSTAIRVIAALSVVSLGFSNGIKHIVTAEVSN